jgi:PAS domain S-box-containing protein
LAIGFDGCTVAWPLMAPERRDPVPGLPFRVSARIVPGALVAAIGLVIVIGRLSAEPTLASFIPGQPEAKFNTGIALLCAGAALLLHTLETHRNLARGLAALTAAIGAATLLEYISGHRLGIDQLLLHDPGGHDGRPAGRPGSNTALCLTLCGAALIAPNAARGRLHPGEIAAGATFLIALAAALGYVFGAAELSRGLITSTVPMSFPSAIALLALSVGLVGCCPDSRLAERFTAQGAGGVLLRRTVVAAVAVPIVLGLIRLAGQRAGLYGTEEGLALYCTSLIATFLALLLWVSGRLEAVDEERRDVDRRLAHLASIVESSNDAILTCRLDSTVISWNHGAEAMLGYSADEMVGRTAGALVPAIEDDDAVAATVDSLHRGDVVSRETTRLHRDGHVIHVSLSAFPIQDASGQITAAAVIYRDIGERKHLEAQLRQAQKMEAVGQLAGGVAHDFNNLLTVIKGYTALAIEDGGAGSTAADHLAQVQGAAERAAELTRQLLAFSRQQVLNPIVLDLHEVIQSLVPMLRRLIGEDVAVITHDDVGVGTMADRGQVEQVIVNLAVNAQDAMPDGGTLTIEARAVELDAEYAADHLGAEPGRFACLTVTDTGVGMDVATLERIFDPFFTTKEVGAGTGLGLATVHGIATQSGGSVHAYSEPGIGTCFKVYLPAAELRGAADAAQPRRVQRRPDATETILLCEDEDAVRRLTDRILTRQGYTVLAAARPTEALELARDHVGTIDAIISDVIMPEMSGPQLVQQLQELHDGMPALFVSGYTAETVTERGGLPPGSGFLEKPFTADLLQEAVRRLLDDHPP